MEKRKKVYQYTLDHDLVKEWESITEATSAGFSLPGISSCCNGHRKKHKGYLWSFTELEGEYV